MRKAEKSAVIITIRDAASMSEEGKKDIAAWMVRQAKDLVEHGKEYSKTCICKYRYFEELKGK